MAYGLLVKNSSGYIQIDDNYSNYTLIASGSVTINESYDRSIRIATISFPSQSFPVSVCIGNTGSAFVACVSRTSTSVGLVASATVTISYRIYGLISVNPGTTSGYGLIVKNGSGGVVFNSNLPYMRIGQITTSTVGNETLPTVTHGYGANFVDITNTGSGIYMFLAYIEDREQSSHLQGIGIRVANGSWTYGKVYVRAMPGLTGIGGGAYPNRPVQAMVLAA
jgi:hypothetical protein